MEMENEIRLQTCVMEIDLWIFMYRENWRKKKTLDKENASVKIADDEKKNDVEIFEAISHNFSDVWIQLNYFQSFLDFFSFS